jgi:hypothetical protein
MKLNLTTVLVVLIICITVLVAVNWLSNSPSSEPATNQNAGEVAENADEQVSLPPSESLPPVPSDVTPPPAEPAVELGDTSAPDTDDTEVVACTLDVKECPDGTYVSRVAPSCEFAACPPVSDVATPEAEEPVACTMDVMECPGGSYVGRVAPSCEFAPCPTPEPESPALNLQLQTN